MSLRWWPDGRSLVIRGSANDKGTSVAELRDRETGRPVRAFPVPGATGDVAPFADGSAFIYTTRTAVREVRLSDLRDSVLFEVPAPWSVNQAPGISVSRSGDRVAVSIVRQNPIVAAAMTFSRTARTAREIPFPVNAFPVGGADEHVLLAVPFNPAGGRSQMFSHNEETGHTKDLGLHVEQLRHLRIHPDGRQLLFSAGQTKLEFWWLENAER